MNRSLNLLFIFIVLIQHVTPTFQRHEGSATKVRTIPEYIRNIFPGPNPHFRIRPYDQEVTVGDKFARFHCVPAGDHGLSVEWKILSSDGEVVIGERHVISKDGTRLEIVEPIEFYDGFVVECRLFSPFVGTPLVATAKLHVRYLSHPVLVARPRRSRRYRRGSRVVLECAAHGWPLPRIGWMFVARRYPVKRFFEADREYRDFIKEPNRLIILSMKPSLEGTYTCVAYNRLGHDKATSHVLFDPRKLRRPNIRHIVTTLRGVYRHYHDYARTAERKLNRKATCNLEVINQFSWLPHVSRRVDGMTMTFDYLLGVLERMRHEGHRDLPGEAANIDVPLLQYIKANLNCSSGAAAPVPDCDRYAEYLGRYAALDGACNNPLRPTWGQAGRGFRRELQSQYELGINLPQGYQKHRLYGGFPKPSARKVSLHVMLKFRYTVDRAVNQMFNYFGQFLDHDIDLTPGASTDRGLVYSSDCNKHCRVDLPCFPIPTPRDDPRVKGCITFKRSAAFCSSGEFSTNEHCIRPREQMNQITSFIDASGVYGSSCSVSRLLRNLDSPSGFLKTSAPAPGQTLDLLPIGIDGVPTACGRNSEAPRAPCYQAGDVRSNEFLLLTTIHTMAVREHNRIGHALHKLNPHWCPDKVFYETRRVVGALLQQITYNEYLPVLIGATGMHELVGPYRGYQSNVDPRISNVFATAAFRIGHTMVSDAFALLDKDYRLVESLSLESSLFAPHVIAKHGIDGLIRGAISVALKSARSGSATMARGVVDRLFEKTSRVASDLGALNTQRGRDHGLPSYNYWRVLCGLRWATKWEHLAGEIRDPEALRKLKDVYGSPMNVDLFPAIVLENRVDDALMGPTARCLLARQFKALRDGDRFWFENPGQFERAQVQEIRRYSFSRLICNTVESINNIQPEGFFFPRTRSDLVPCESLPDIDLNAWKDFDRRRKCMPETPCDDSRRG